jgi:cell division initiation protein
MEITGKVLREVEFRDRLRGYDTDEVDEFLEEVAIAVDELYRRLASSAGGHSAAATEAQEPLRVAEPTFDDDSIRRTLILAQRTADMAIKEAADEAARILDSARREAQELVGQATESARRLREEADMEFSNRVSAQLGQREQLERDVHTLNALVIEERSRLSSSLQTLLRFVDDQLSVSGDVTARAGASALVITAPEPSAPEPTSSPPAPQAAAEAFLPDRREKPEVDLPPEEVSEDPLTFTAPLPVVPPTAKDEVAPLVTSPAPPAPPEPVPAQPSTAPATSMSPGDKDEELWQRWANGGGFDEEETNDENDPFGFNRRP